MEQANDEKDLKVALKDLKNTSDQIVPIGLEIIEANGCIYTFDLFAHSVLNRGLSLINGFIHAIETENFLCAAPLVRMHLDNLLRFYASYIVDDMGEFAMKVLNGEKIKDLKDKNGNKMTDYYLVKEVTKRLPWVERVYEETCGYVHLSDKHIFNAVAPVKGKEKTIHVHVSGKDKNVPDRLRIEATEIMLEVTKQIFVLMKIWIDHKKTLIVKDVDV